MTTSEITAPRRAGARAMLVAEIAVGTGLPWPLTSGSRTTANRFASNLAR